MVEVYQEVYRIKGAYLYGRWVFVGLLLLATVLVLYFMAFNGQTYPDLDFLLSFYSIAGFLWLMIPFDFMTVTVNIETASDGFWMKKLGRRSCWYPYSAIVAHNERPNSTKMESFDELTIYLTDNWFVIRSNEYKDYTDLKNLFTQFGQSVKHQNVITVFERNLIRWLISGTALIIAANIGFGFLAHNVTDDTPARLIPITDVASQALEDRGKSGLKGVTIYLRSYPAFGFYVSQRDYEISLAPLKQAIQAGQPIELEIRESDFRKKLTKAEPLTFGDKYSDYREISVFTAEQTNRFRLVSPSPVYEQKRTNPVIRTFLFGFLLLLCWTVWVFVDQHKVLRAT
jgi:hypothetical protein